MSKLREKYHFKVQDFLFPWWLRTIDGEERKLLYRDACAKFVSQDYVGSAFVEAQMCAGVGVPLTLEV